MRIDVFLPGMYAGDGVSHDAICIRDAMRAHGIQSDIFADHAHTSRECRATAAHYETYAARREPADAVLYEFSSASPVTTFLAARGEPLILRYQNVTPPGYFEPFDPGFADQLRLAREELASLAMRTAATVSSSRFNAAELQTLGFRANHVLPNFCRLPRPSPPPAPEAPPRIVFVGRVAPNKCQHHAVQAFATFEAATQSGGELVLAGSLESCPTYSTLVRALARETGANIRFTGHLADASPVYAGAHLFLSMSEHEGFCMPVAEAMAAGVPVLAYAAAAVPDTVGNGGILFSRKSIPDVAELVAALVGDSARLSALREAGMTRVRDFAHDRLAGALAGILADCGFRP